jgi:EF hand
MRPLLLLALLAAGTAFAQEKKEESASGGATAPRPNFSAAPRNDALSEALFSRLDKNRDGYLTGAELTTGEALTSNWLAVDRDADGRISRAEFSVVETSGEVARK